MSMARGKYGLGGEVGAGGRHSEKECGIID